MESERAIARRKALWYPRFRIPRSTRALSGYSISPVTAALNLFIVSKLLGLLVATIGLSMLPSFGWSVYFNDGAQTALAESMIVTLVMGGALYAIGRLRERELYTICVLFVPRFRRGR